MRSASAFIEFVNKVPFYGAAIVCLDDENVQQILPEVNRRVITYGTGAQAMLVISHSPPAVIWRAHSVLRLRGRRSRGISSWLSPALTTY